MTPSPNFLQTILAHKAHEVAERKQQTPERTLRTQIEPARVPRSLSQALSGEAIAVIAEIKKASPSAGVIRADFEPVQIATSYLRANATALSILTDEKYFQGSLDYIRRVRPLADVPILRKDFISDPYQILEARAAGADALLLIVAALSQEQLRQLVRTTSAFGLEALVEVHSADEMRRAADAGATIIGINNRNLDTFQIDLATTEQLAPLAPPGVVLVAESGLHTAADVQRMRDAGVDAVLVGTRFMQHPDPGAALQELMAPSGDQTSFY